MPAIFTYADSSVYGGVFDDEFSAARTRFFELVRSGRFALLVSDVVRREIELAPPEVRMLFQDHLAYMSLVRFDSRVYALRDAYLAQKILKPRWSDDAAHVAAATVGGATLIVSWNFRHIVHFERIRLYNAVNVLHGYRELDIRSPAEVIEYEEETD